MNKILFLDIDGVICLDTSGHEWDSVCVEYLRKVLDQTHSKLVITSTWKIQYLYRRLMFKRFKEFNLVKYLHTDSITKNIKLTLDAYDGHRGREINEWLSRHSEVTDYLIIDDIYNFLPEHLSKFIKVNTIYGFGEKEYNLIINEWKSLI